MATLVFGQSGTNLDIYIKSGTTLFDPYTWPVYSIYNAASALQGSGSGIRLSVGHYNASNFIIPSSGGLGSWSIIWNVGGTTKTEQFTVAEPTLTEIGDEINVLQELMRAVRFDIGDVSQTIFTDYQIQIYVEKAVKRLNRELGISEKVRPTGVTPGGIGPSVIMSPIRVNFNDGTIWPNNDEIKDIVTLQTEVLITRAEMSALRRASAAAAATAVGAELMTATSGIIADNGVGIMVRNADGVTIDTTSRMTSWLSNKTRLFLDEAAQREKDLESALKRMKHSFAGNYGKVIY